MSFCFNNNVYILWKFNSSKLMKIGKNQKHPRVNIAKNHNYFVLMVTFFSLKIHMLKYTVKNKKFPHPIANHILFLTVSTSL
jgi:hypothetical protein